MTPSILRFLTSTALLFSLGEIVSCEPDPPPCGEYPALPLEGQYVDTAEHSYVAITFDSIEIVCDEMTFRYTDEAGEAQYVTYRIEARD